MEQYVGLDVSLDETSVCVIDQSGSIVFEVMCHRDRQPLKRYWASGTSCRSDRFRDWKPIELLWHELRILGFQCVA